MALRTIMTQEQPTLHKVARPVTNFDQRLHDLLDDMTETLADANGAGLAAPQVGILRRIFLIDVDDRGVIEFINPEILETSGEQDGIEGCLSLPGEWGMVKRPDHVRVRAQDRNGAWFEQEGDGLAASTIAACDYTVKIPMTHGVDSLNVAAASAVAFYQLCLLAK